MFHRDMESVTFHVTGEQRTEQQHHTSDKDQ